MWYCSCPNGSGVETPNTNDTQPSGTQFCVCMRVHTHRFISLVVVCYLDRTALAFAALQLCHTPWFNAKVYGLVSWPVGEFGFMGG